MIVFYICRVVAPAHYLNKLCVVYWGQGYTIKEIEAKFLIQENSE